MIKSHCVSLVSLSVLLLFSCKNKGEDLSVKLRLEMKPAETAEDWLTRLQLDLDPNIANLSSSGLLRNYAELPEPDEWEAIVAKLDAVTKDKEAYRKYLNIGESQHSFRSDNLEVARLELNVFSKLLAEKDEEVEMLYRQVLKAKNADRYSHFFSDNDLSKLLLLSKDPVKSAEWYQANMKSDDDDTDFSSNSEKEPWRKALAENRIDEGIELLKKKMNGAKMGEKGEFISSLAKLAHLLNKPELGKEVMNLLEEDLISAKKSESHFSMYAYEGALDYLAHKGEWQVLYDLCDKAITAKSSRDEEQDTSLAAQSKLYSYQLTALYQLGKFAEFDSKLKLLIEDKKTRSVEVFNFLDKNIIDHPSIGSLYVDRLVAKDEKDLAFKFCAHLLARNQSTDAYYKRAIEIDQKAASTLIDGLRKYDPYEERPLIWQAEMALQAGDIEKADELINKAIALDPSDGDHGKDTRMFCYDVLARILEKQGDAEKAQFFNEVVISIREGEAADDYLYAGLIQEASDRYKKALGHFNDAYCLQSRLAKTLMEAGKFDEAIPHFKKAFELMPVSFGPRESHCFGCEGIFDDERVQDLALPVLRAFLEKEPDNPRTPYLLGLLFEEMKKEAEAITAYQKAIELDPNYYNAATSLHRLLRKDPKKFDQVKALEQQIFEIAPYGEKADYIPNPHKLRAYWVMAKNFPQSPLSLVPLSELGLSNEEALSDEQFMKHSISGNNFLRHMGYPYYDEEMALDGWSQRELLMRNKFLQSF